MYVSMYVCVYIYIYTHTVCCTNSYDDIYYAPILARLFIPPGAAEARGPLVSQRNISDYVIACLSYVSDYCNSQISDE